MAPLLSVCVVGLISILLRIYCQPFSIIAATRLRDSPRAQVYLPLRQEFVPHIIIAARTTHGQRIAGPIRQVVTSMNSNLPILTSQTLEEAVALTLLPQRLGAFLSGSLGIVGLLLATMGIYGVTAFAVAQREIGIRMALGATRTAVVGMILRFGLTLVTGGAVGRSGVQQTREHPDGAVTRSVYVDVRRTFSARGPFGPWPTSNSTLSPSRRSSIRSPETALW